MTNASHDWIFEVLTAVLVKIQVLRDMTPCIFLMYMPPSSWSKQFKKNCSDPENGDNKLHLPGVIIQMT